ncbi:MAG TPA: sulfurtransferase [Aquabacterium sp.]|nr:sulfurtransferase [Aquabacterium sp.]HQC99509.1 sulfurtransferase [Aquabacterium sp.]
MPDRFLNIATYRFTPLADLPALRQRLFDTAEAHAVRGTVLLAEEGINLCLAGPPAGIAAWLAAARATPGLETLPTKDSWSDTQPFGKLKVKIKREIIRMNMPTVRPAAGRAPAVDARTLARWLAQGHCDEGRPVTMLDTRNGFEVDAGAFDGAVDWRLAKFSDFPAALAAHRDAFAGHTVVSYCTGGIRCEKAALVMQDLGIANALQLEGGILKYFEDTGGAAPGWRGACFVFDERVALAPDLQPALITPVTA